jgi:hypothetical protein
MEVTMTETLDTKTKTKTPTNEHNARREWDDPCAETPVTKENLSRRLEELRKNHETITQEMEKLEAHRQQGASTLLMLTGAIQMLEELSGTASSTAAE